MLQIEGVSGIRALKTNQNETNHGVGGDCRSDAVSNMQVGHLETVHLLRVVP